MKRNATRKQMISPEIRKLKFLLVLDTQNLLTKTLNLVKAMSVDEHMNYIMKRNMVQLYNEKNTCVDQQLNRPVKNPRPCACTVRAWHCIPLARQYQEYPEGRPPHL